MQYSVRGSQRHDRPLDGGRDGARAGMPGTVWMAGGASVGTKGRGLFDERPEQGRIVVRALGRQLRVRDERGVASAGDGLVDGAGLLRARGELAAAGAEGRRKFWRVA